MKEKISKFMDNPNKKSIFMLILISMLIVSFSIGTYALLLWNSNNNTELTVKIGDVAGVYFETGNNINVSNLGPIFDYEKDGESTYFTISNYVNEPLVIDSYFNISSISNNLKDDSFKYVFMSSSDKINYVKVKEGTFSNVNANDSIPLLEEYTILPNETRSFKLIIYIDGNAINPIEMQNGSLTGLLSVSEHIFGPTINNVTTSSTSSAITLEIDATSKVGNVEKYYCSSDNGNTFTESATNICTLTGLSALSTYKVVVYAEDSEGNISEYYNVDVETAAYTWRKHRVEEVLDEDSATSLTVSSIYYTNSVYASNSYTIENGVFTLVNPTKLMYNTNNLVGKYVVETRTTSGSPTVTSGSTIYKIETYNRPAAYTTLTYTAYTSKKVMGTQLEEVTSTNSSAYPMNGLHTDGYWYVMKDVKFDKYVLKKAVSRIDDVDYTYVGNAEDYLYVHTGISLADDYKTLTLTGSNRYQFKNIYSWKYYWLFTFEDTDITTGTGPVFRTAQVSGGTADATRTITYWKYMPTATSGDFIETTNTCDADTYPLDGHQDGYYWIVQTP